MYISIKKYANTFIHLFMHGHGHSWLSAAEKQFLFWPRNWICVINPISILFSENKKAETICVWNVD